MIEAVALFDYTGRTDKELSFKKNQRIYIFKKMNQEWWQGYLAGGSESGYVPDGYIKLKARSVRRKEDIEEGKIHFVLDVEILHRFHIIHH